MKETNIIKLNKKVLEYGLIANDEKEKIAFFDQFDFILN
jgi:hypothetical protein